MRYGFEFIPSDVFPRVLARVQRFVKPIDGAVAREEGFFTERIGDQGSMAHVEVNRKTHHITVRVWGESDMACCNLRLLLCDSIEATTNKLEGMTLASKDLVCQCNQAYAVDGAKQDLAEDGEVWCANRRCSRHGDKCQGQGSTPLLVFDLMDGGREYLAQATREADQRRAEEAQRDAVLRATTHILHASEQKALDGTRKLAELNSIAARGDLLQRCQNLVRGFEESNLDDIASFIRDRAEILINFAPFGKASDGFDSDLRSGTRRSLLQILAEDPSGTYKNLFETGTSGGLNDLATRRDTERGLFGDAYDVDHSINTTSVASSAGSSSSSSSSTAAIDELRPKYG
jgi:hypothetical protein